MKHTPTENLELHLHWHPCPLCGELISDQGNANYYDKNGEWVYVPCWLEEGTVRQHHLANLRSHQEETEWCYPFRDMPLPSNGIILRVIKWLLK